MRRLLWVLVLAALAMAGAVALRAPRTRATGTTLTELERRLRDSGAEGPELANQAIREVALAFRRHSAWHLWEDPERALARGRGWSHQYNTVLLLLLRRLGFDARLVHAARVRGFNRPWFMSGHTWVKVRIGGHWRNACASSPDNRVGRVGFVALTDELPMRARTRLAGGLALMVFVVYTVWKAWLTGKRVPRWVYHEHSA